ncbi:MAG: hypothetical protein JNM89_00350 [Hyphomicrobiaceae bacterium]|nr:hypothetical protein [Hyphomicrobiaceae bacterium]
MQSAANPTASTSVPAVARRQPSHTADRALGIVLMSVVPAIFWTTLAAGVSPLFGYEIESTTLLQIGAGIALFLAVVAAALMQRSV